MQHTSRATILMLCWTLAGLPGAGGGSGSAVATACEKTVCDDPTRADRAPEAHAVSPQPTAEALLAQYVATLQAQDGERLEAVLHLWRYAADHGVPEAAVTALEEAAHAPEAAIARQARAALADLHRLQDASAHAAPVSQEPIDAVDGAPLPPWAAEHRRGPRDAHGALRDVHGQETVEAVLHFWARAADQGAPASVFAALASAAQHPEEAIAWQATRALADLQRVRDSLWAAAVPQAEDHHTADPTGETLAVPHDAAISQTSVAVEAWEVLSARDDTSRATAVHELIRHRHPETLAVLMQVAMSDSVPALRYQAVEALWYAAADGLDLQGVITATLTEALADPDARIAALAAWALADLYALAQ